MPYTTVNMSQPKSYSRGIHCSTCFRVLTPAEYKCCAKCHIVTYCSKACQAMDWSVHKRGCADLAAGKPLPRATGFIAVCAEDGSGRMALVAGSTLTDAERTAYERRMKMTYASTAFDPSKSPLVVFANGYDEEHLQQLLQECIANGSLDNQLSALSQPTAEILD
jgi:hypothetical protein